MNWKVRGAATIGLALALSCPSLPASASTTPACAPIPGWEKVLAREELKWIVIGELHGTEETPVIFADAVCLTALERGPVVVGLEVPSSDQPIIDAFMESDGEAEARGELLKMLLWHMPMKDGRSSEAFLRLFERLRQMHDKGLVNRVVAFQDNLSPFDPSHGQGPYEERLAAIVRATATDDATLMVLVGSTHAMKTEVDFGTPFLPMSGLLPKAETLTLLAVGNGGSAWNCQGPTAADCEAHKTAGPPEPMARGVELGPVMNGAYDGALWLGVPTTASSPQAVP